MPDLSFSLKRVATSGGCTLGTITADSGNWRAFTCEPPPTAAHPDIPPGRYEIRMAWSPRFSRLVPLLQGVPGRAYIEIHPGNDAADTEGCILLGYHQTATGVQQSSDAVHAFVVKVQAALTDPSAKVFLTVDQPASPMLAKARVSA